MIGQLGWNARGQAPLTSNWLVEEYELALRATEGV
jgi:hypothetical protein